MKIFHCDHCNHIAFFENTQCVNCGHRLAFLPDLGRIGSLERVGADCWSSPGDGGSGQRYRLCQNYREAQICNWAVEVGDSNALCRSCRLTRVIPDLNTPGHREAWYRVESAKRRLLYTLLSLELPVTTMQDDPERGLAFELLADTANGNAPVLTGHAERVITINIAEADDAERERRRLSLREPYRTLVGHLRHEIAHYYWNRLIDGTERLEPFRWLFGDERADYARALERHYGEGPPPDWQTRFVSAYASAHPWEDWAETWAHYLHIADTLQTAAACGVSIRPHGPGEPSLAEVPASAGTRAIAFESLIASWYPITYVLNNLNRGLGLPDAYPFVLSPPAVEKLRFVHETVTSA
jgi:hypothetical protein